MNLFTLLLPISIPRNVKYRTRMCLIDGYTPEALISIERFDLHVTLKYLLDINHGCV